MRILFYILIIFLVSCYQSRSNTQEEESETREIHTEVVQERQEVHEGQIVTLQTKTVTTQLEKAEATAASTQIQRTTVPVQPFMQMAGKAAGFFGLDPWFDMVMYAVLGTGATGAGAYAYKKRHPKPKPLDHPKVIARKEDK